MKFKISNRFDGSILFSGEFGSLKLCVEAAIKSKANLRYADLRSANLQYADLHSADLRYANLQYADLRYANLRYADLHYADLRYANLQYADLHSADLHYANLQYADLRYANLRSANLQSANLRYADGLTAIKADVWMRLTLQRNEVPGLLQAIKDGKIDGSQYQGECACFVGTIANIAHVNYQQLPNLKPDSGSLTEVWFTAISKGSTPENNVAAKLAAEWIEEWLSFQPDLKAVAE